VSRGLVFGVLLEQEAFVYGEGEWLGCGLRPVRA